MSDLYNVVMQGATAPGMEKDEVKKNLAVIFRESEEKMEQLLSGKQVTVKKQVSREQADKIEKALKKAGAACEVVKHQKAVPQNLVMDETDNQGQDEKAEETTAASMQASPAGEAPLLAKSDPYKTPAANLFETKPGINALSEFERVSTWLLFFLSMITLGIYSFYWLYSRTNILNRLPSVQPISSSFMNATIIFWVLSFLMGIGDAVLTGTGNTHYVYTIISNIVSIIATVMPIVWCFKFRNRLNTFLLDHAGNGRHLGPILTFFFQSLYLSYKLNENIDMMNAQS